MAQIISKDIRRKAISQRGKFQQNVRQLDKVSRELRARSFIARRTRTDLGKVKRIRRGISTEKKRLRSGILELSDIAKLPTRNEFLIELKTRIKQARRLVSRGVATKFAGELSPLVREIRKQRSLKTIEGIKLKEFNRKVRLFNTRVDRFIRLDKQLRKKFFSPPISNVSRRNNLLSRLFRN